MGQSEKIERAQMNANVFPAQVDGAVFTLGDVASGSMAGKNGELCTHSCDHFLRASGADGPKRQNLPSSRVRAMITTAGERLLVRRTIDSYGEVGGSPSRHFYIVFAGCTSSGQ